MLKKTIIVAVCICVPAAFYIALQYGQLKQVTFQQAIEQTQTDMEGDQAPKVIVVSTISAVQGSELMCTDAMQQQFRVEYTGSDPEDLFKSGVTVRFVGHVHGGTTPYFHATQVYAQ